VNKVAAVTGNELGRDTAAERKRLQHLRKVCRDGAEVTRNCKLFQMREAATGNALSPTVNSVEHKQ